MAASPIPAIAAPANGLRQDEMMLLRHPWPIDLHPSRVPFRRRTLTVMERAGLFDHPTAIDDLTEADVLSWENAGVRTLQDFIEAEDRSRSRSSNSDPGRRL